MAHAVTLRVVEVARHLELLRDLTPHAMLRWAWETFEGKVAASSSFQTQSLPLLHMISRTVPEMPVLFLDTGFHFPETLAFRDEVVELLGLNLVNVHPDVSPAQLVRRLGPEPYRSSPSRCCQLNKVEPMQRAAARYEVLVSGVRADQTALRSQLPLLQERGHGPLRLHPLLHWSREQVFGYHQQHALPRHPLDERGYASIGCAPCTAPVAPGADERSGRWPGLAQLECGLHSLARSSGAAAPPRLPAAQSLRRSAL